MAIYIRRVGEIADGSITEQKLADLAVSTVKLKDQAVTLAKSVQAMKIHHFVGDETEQSVTGLTETDIKFFAMPKAASINSGLRPTNLHINAEVKVTGGTTPTGTLKVYFDSEPSARITVTTTSGTFEMQEALADISDLSSGKHTVRVTLVADEADATMVNDLIEIFLEK